MTSLFNERSVVENHLSSRNEDEIFWGVKPEINFKERRNFTEGDRHQPETFTMIMYVKGQRTLLPDTFLPVMTILAPKYIHATLEWESSNALISKNFSYLETSGWYWGAISASEAHSVLQEASEGTFLVRDSSHPAYMLTLSVKTARGPTNVRIRYSYGRFSLDSSSSTKSRLQTFRNVPSLVQHYVGFKSGQEGDKTEELDPISSPTSKECGVLLKLKRPVCHPQAFPSLQHLARLVINRHSTCTESLPLPKPVLQYLQDYPFQL